MNTTVTLDINGEDFSVNGMNFRFYNDKLWIDGGAGDDLVIRDIEVDEDAEEVEITITAGYIEKYEFAVANGLGDAAN